MTDLNAEMDRFFLIVMGMIIFLMQCGFAFLEAGSVRSKNTSNILIKNLLDSFVAGISYWLLGYPFAFGKGNSFMGWTHFASDGLDDGDLAFWFFQFVFAATAATIVSGALAERCEFVAYFFYSFVITAWVYPIVTHWAWHEDGWLKVGDEYEIDGTMTPVGYEDFAGSGVVHCVGGAAAFVGAALIGPRKGRFHNEDDREITIPIRGHSVPFAAMGAFILFFGFMAFNGGSQTSISNVGDGAVISLAIANTVISGSISAFFTLFMQKFRAKKWSILGTINGGLAGMVAICAGCNVIRPWGAVIVGLLAGAIYNFTSWLMIKMKIDDPLDAVAVHYGGGSWGVLSVPLLKYTSDAKGLIPLLFNGDWDRRAGLLLAWQLAGIVTITVWSVVLCAIVFGLLRICNKLRVDAETEQKGLDIAEHGEPAYPPESYGHGYIEHILRILQNGKLGELKLGCNNDAFIVDENGINTQMFEHPETLAMGHTVTAKTETHNKVVPAPVL